MYKECLSQFLSTFIILHYSYSKKNVIYHKKLPWDFWRNSNNLTLHSLLQQLQYYVILIILVHSLLFYAAKQLYYPICMMKYWPTTISITVTRNCLGKIMYIHKTIRFFFEYNARAYVPMDKIKWFWNDNVIVNVKSWPTDIFIVHIIIIIIIITTYYIIMYYTCDTCNQVLQILRVRLVPFVKNEKELFNFFQFILDYEHYTSLDGFDFYVYIINILY